MSNIIKKELSTTDNKPTVLFSEKLDITTLQQQEEYRRTLRLQSISIGFDVGSGDVKSPTDFVNYFVSPVTYYRIVVVAFDKKGYKSAAWEKSILISGASGAQIVGTPSSVLTQKEDAGLNCEFITSVNDFIIRVTGLPDASVCWIARIEKII